MSDLKADGKVIKSEFFHSNELGWYAMLQLQLRGEDFFIAQQLPEKVTGGWERWIPVSERLPDMHGTFIVAIYVRSRKRMYSDSAVFDPVVKRWRTHTFWGKGMKVTHWMPLPEPPQEKDDGNR